MSFLIGCNFQKDQGWRAKKCLSVPGYVPSSRVAVGGGLLWMESETKVRGGQYDNPVKLLRSN